jgi:hypothetical protein
MARTTAFFTCLLAATLLAGGAYAEDDSATARALFDEGRALMDQNDAVKACPKFEASLKLAPKASTALNLGVCFEALGKHASAWSAFGTAETLAQREANEERRALAVQKRAEAEAALARIQIHAEATEGLEITLDGKPVLAAMLGSSLPIDPGKHTVAARAPGKKTWTKEVEVPGDKALIPVDIPALEADNAGPQPDAVPKPEPISPDEQGGGGISAAAWVGFGVGAAGIVVGAITGIVAISKTNAIEENCNDEVCPATERAAIDDATIVANISNVSFAIGAAGIIVGVVGLFLPTGGDDEAALAPVIGPGYLGVRGGF